MMIGFNQIPHGVSRRPGGRIPSTNVTNELTDALNGFVIGGSDGEQVYARLCLVNLLEHITGGAKRGIYECTVCRPRGSYNLTTVTAATVDEDTPFIQKAVFLNLLGGTDEMKNSGPHWAVLTGQTTETPPRPFFTSVAIRTKPC